MNNKIFKYMIVFTKNKERYNNFFEIKKEIIELEMFEAYDSINNLDSCLQINKLYNLNTDEYINQWVSKKIFGKIGCNISHFMLLKMILHNNKIDNDDWIIILEDDIVVKNYDETIINDLCNKANDVNSKFIHLCVSKKFMEKQFNEKNLIDENIYKMIPQWSTTAFLIKKSMINFLFNNLPCDCNIDIFFGKYIDLFNGLVFKNNIISNMGSENSKDVDTKFGSLIWNK